MSEQEQFPVGARVRLNGWCSWYGREGVVRDPPFGHHGYPDMRYVLWEDNSYRWHEVASLERADTPAPEPPRAPARTLAPGIEQSDDTCDGKPRLAGMRLPTDSVLGWPDWEAFREAHPYLVREQEADYYHALCFEAGRAWERERRRRRKERRAVKRWQRAKALAEGVRDGD